MRQRRIGIFISTAITLLGLTLPGFCEERRTGGSDLTCSVAVTIIIPDRKAQKNQETEKGKNGEMENGEAEKQGDGETEKQGDGQKGD